MPAKDQEPPRVMDITHPKDVRPSSTSKPVIVTNRPMIAEDPMIAQAAREAAEKGAELPAGAPSAPLVPPDEPTVNRQAKTVKPISVSQDQDKEVQANTPTPKPETTESIDTSSETDKPASEAAEAEPVQSTETTERTTPEASSEPATAEHAPAPQAADTTGESTIAGLSVDDSETDEDGEPRPETPEEKRSHDLESHVAKGTYFVPINQVGKRRSRMVLTAVLIVVLALITLDLLLDMGIINISGVPHTTFFSL